MTVYLCKYCRTALDDPSQDHPCLEPAEKEKVDYPLLNTSKWGKLYLVCRGCGVAGTSLWEANEHYTVGTSSDPGVCAEEGYDIVPESEWWNGGPLG